MKYTPIFFAFFFTSLFALPRKDQTPVSLYKRDSLTRNFPMGQIQPSQCADVGPHNGDMNILTQITIHTVFYGDFSADTKAAYVDFVNNLDTSAWYQIFLKNNVQTSSTGGATIIPNVHHLNDKYVKSGTVFHDFSKSFGSSLQSTDHDKASELIKYYIATGNLPAPRPYSNPVPENWDVYNLVTDSTVSFSSLIGGNQMTLGTGLCGYHFKDSYNGTDLLYMFTPTPDPSANCGIQTNQIQPFLGTKGDFDSMINTLAHEIIELQSDAFIDNFHTAGGQEVGDQCGFIFGPKCQKKNEIGQDVFVNAKVGNKEYLLQTVFDRNTFNYCVGDPNYYSCPNDDQKLCHEASEGITEAQQVDETIQPAPAPDDNGGGFLGVKLPDPAPAPAPAPAPPPPPPAIPLGQSCNIGDTCADNGCCIKATLIGTLYTCQPCPSFNLTGLIP